MLFKKLEMFVFFSYFINSFCKLYLAILQQSEMYKLKGKWLRKLYKK